MKNSTPNLPASSRMQMPSGGGSQIKGALKAKPLVVSGGAIKGKVLGSGSGASKASIGAGKGTTKKVMSAAKGKGKSGCGY
jgi:hypothetical protein